MCKFKNMTFANDSQKSNSAESNLSILRIAIRGLLFYRGMLWPVALGVAAATAVIVGCSWSAIVYVVLCVFLPSID